MILNVDRSRVGTRACSVQSTPLGPWRPGGGGQRQRRAGAGRGVRPRVPMKVRLIPGTRRKPYCHNPDRQDQEGKGLI